MEPVGVTVSLEDYLSLEEYEKSQWVDGEHR